MQTASLVAVLLADALLPVLPALHALRLQGLPDRGPPATSAALRRGCMIDNTHVVVLARHGRGHGAGAGDGGLRRALRLRLRGAREGRRQPLGPRRAPLRLHREQLPRRARPSRTSADLNAQALAWCDKVNATRKRHLHASAARALRRRAAPPAARCRSGCPRSTCSTTGSSTSRATSRCTRNRYSVPAALDRPAAWRCARRKDRVDIFDGPRGVASHAALRARRAGPTCCSPSTGHRAGQGQTAGARPEETGPARSRARAAASYVAALEEAAVATRRPSPCGGCSRMRREYPEGAVPRRRRGRRALRPVRPRPARAHGAPAASPATTSSLPADERHRGGDDER